MGPGRARAVDRAKTFRLARNLPLPVASGVGAVATALWQCLLLTVAEPSEPWAPKAYLCACLSL